MSRATDLLAELVRADTVGAHEADLARRCAGILDETGLDAHWVDWSADGREQYVARTGGDTPLTLTGHLDTVPATPSDWSVDPWAAAVDGDRMIGRGTSDMKSGVAAIVEAVSGHTSRSHDCRGVQVVLTSGEETGCTGALAIPRDALAPGGPLVVAEPTRNALVPGHKGAHWMCLSATGKAAHGSSPDLGDNAAVKVARAAVALHDFDGWPAGVTANVGVLRGGVQTNVVPDQGEIYLDLRTVPSAQGDSVRDLVRSVAGDDVRVEDHVVLPPVDTALSDPFVGLVGEALAATGLDGSPVETARYFTDASALIPALSDGATTPTVILGPGEPEQCHVADEWCSLARVDQAVAVYAELLDRWCAGR
jgi:succinyl-diaminopimelate desuccinylase